MAYLTGVIGATVAALVIGSAFAAASVVKAAFERLAPEDKAVILASSISEAMNCAVFFFLLFVPVAVIVVFVTRRRRRRSGREG
jgi:hypothetical protein